MTGLGGVVVFDVATLIKTIVMGCSFFLTAEMLQALQPALFIVLFLPITSVPCHYCCQQYDMVRQILLVGWSHCNKLDYLESQSRRNNTDIKGTEPDTVEGI